jgi:hypothetical protein
VLPGEPKAAVGAGGGRVEAWRISGAECEWFGRGEVHNIIFAHVAPRVKALRAGVNTLIDFDFGGATIQVAAGNSHSSGVKRPAQRASPAVDPLNVIGLTYFMGGPPMADGACKSVGSATVGQSGLFGILSHTVQGPTRKLMVLRTVQSGLCPSHGAVATLTIDGVLAGTQDMSTGGGILQAEAAPGAMVLAAIALVPKNNGVLCVQLGDVTVRLDECELVTVAANAVGPDGNAAVGLAGGPTTKNWYAWINKMPPPPDEFHVVGEVQVSNPGVEVVLTPRVPQGINPRILLLDLVLVQRPGIWPQIVVTRRAEYHQINGDYERVNIFLNNGVIADIPVDVVH